MKRALLSILFTAGLIIQLSAAPTFTVHLGMDFFNYKSNYLDTGFSILNEFQNNVEFNSSADFAITTVESDGAVQPSFYIPIDLGLNFLFPKNSLSFVFGTGISTVFNTNPTADKEFNLFIGPFMKGGVRYQVHPLMKLFIEIQQDLLIGGEKWINTSTRVFTGINFSFNQGK